MWWSPFFEQTPYREPASHRVPGRAAERRGAAGWQGEARRGGALARGLARPPRAGLGRARRPPATGRSAAAPARSSRSLRRVCATVCCVCGEDGAGASFKFQVSSCFRFDGSVGLRARGNPSRCWEEHGTGTRPKPAPERERKISPRREQGTRHSHARRTAGISMAPPATERLV